MARLTREEKMLSHGLLALDDLKALYNEDGRAVKEYLKLYDEYKKLNKRYSKTIQMSDSVGKSVILDNAKLQENVDYTIQAAREKLIHNIGEHRKTKDLLHSVNQELSIIESNYKKQLDQAHDIIAQMKIENQKLKKNQSKNLFNSSDNLSGEDINTPLLKNKTIQDIVAIKIKKANTTNISFSLVKLIIDEYEDIASQISEIGTINGFLKAILRYLNSICSDKDITFYAYNNIFYILFHNTSTEYVESKITVLNKRKSIGKVSLTFSIGVTNYILNENMKSLLDRVDSANTEASFSNNQCSVVYK